MGKIAATEPNKSFTAAQCQTLLKNRVYGSNGTNSWALSFNHRDTLIDECLVPVLKLICPPTADIERALHSLTNTDLVLLGAHLAPSKGLEHIIRLGIVCRTTKHRIALSIEQLVEILTMTPTASHIYVSNLDDTFRDKLPDLIEHIKKIDNDYQEEGKSVYMFGNITDKTPVELETVCKDIYIPVDQRVTVSRHTEGYGVEILSLQEKVQYLIDNTVLNFFRRTSEQRTPKFLEWFDRETYLGKSNAMVFSIPQMFAHIKLDKNKVNGEGPDLSKIAEEKVVEKTINVEVNASESQDELFLNLRLALMATNTLPRELLVKADNTALLRLAAESIDPSSADITGFMPFYTYDNVGYSRSACIEIVQTEFGLSFKQLACLSDSEITDYMNRHFAEDDDDDFDRDEAIEMLVEYGHKKAQLKKMDDAELNALLDRELSEDDDE
jgi:hypothetical protein